MSTKIFDPKKEIINTLAYKKIFNQPLTIYQIIYFCQQKFETLNEVENYLRQLLESHKIRFNNGYYFLGSSKSKKDELKDIKSKFDISRSTFTKLESYKYIFEKLPFIKFVGVTGSLASYTFNFEKDDIDLFIICEKNRLWTTRLFLVLIFKIFNIYVNDKNSNLKFCPNLYISEENLVWPEDKRSLYVAHEISMMQPLVDKNNTYLRFLNKNNWVNEFTPNLVVANVETFLINNNDLTPLDILENFVMFIQTFLMKVRYGSEILEKDMIHFVKVDHSFSVLENYEKIKS